MKIAFVTNICAHYNVGTFELLAHEYDMDYYFFSAGKEWYWQEEHGYRDGRFHSEYLPGFQIGRTRITLSLPGKLFKKRYDVYIKCINGRFALLVTYLIARLKGKPFILWTGIWTRLQTPMQRLIFPLTRYIYLHSDAIVVYGEHVKKYLITEGVNPERIFVAYHAADNLFYSKTVPESQKNILRTTLRILPDQKVILYLGRLEEIKGVEYLLRAFAKMNRPGIILVIAGAGGLREPLEQLSKTLNIWDRVRFTGYTSIESAPAYYSLASVFVLPSISVKTGKETWGLVVNEAFNQSVPVIATDAVGAAAGGLVQNNVNGFIVSEQDSNALTAALNQLFDDPELRQSFSQNASRIVAEWDYKRNVMGYRQAIEYVLSSK